MCRRNCCTGSGAHRVYTERMIEAQKKHLPAFQATKRGE
jgi:hypothetical protein